MSNAVQVQQVVPCGGYFLVLTASFLSTVAGFWGIIRTPKGMAYADWNKWGNLQMSTTSAFLMLVKAKYNPDPASKAAELQFAQTQVDYALGSAGRSFVVGWGHNPPRSYHHAGASCPDKPASCTWTQFSSKDPNPQVLSGALVGGPMGVRKSADNPDDAYFDKRSDYESNEVANDYNAGFNGALAGLRMLL